MIEIVRENLMASGFRDFTSSNLWNSSMTVNPIEDVSGFQRQEEQDADLSENISIDRLTPSFRSIDDLVIKTIVDLYYNKSGDLERSALKLFYHTEAIATTENLFALHQSLTFTFFNPEIFLQSNYFILKSKTDNSSSAKKELFVTSINIDKTILYSHKINFLFSYESIVLESSLEYNLFTAKPNYELFSTKKPSLMLEYYLEETLYQPLFEYNHHNEMLQKGIISEYSRDYLFVDTLHNVSAFVSNIELSQDYYIFKQQPISELSLNYESVSQYSNISNVIFEQFDDITSVYEFSQAKILPVVNPVKFSDKDVVSSLLFSVSDQLISCVLSQPEFFVSSVENAVVLFSDYNLFSVLPLFDSVKESVLVDKSLPLFYEVSQTKIRPVVNYVELFNQEMVSSVLFSASDQPIKYTVSESKTLVKPIKNDAVLLFEYDLFSIFPVFDFINESVLVRDVGLVSEFDGLLMSEVFSYFQPAIETFDALEYNTETQSLPEVKSLSDFVVDALVISEVSPFMFDESPVVFNSETIDDFFDKPKQYSIFNEEVSKMPFFKFPPREDTCATVPKAEKIEYSLQDKLDAKTPFFKFPPREDTCAVIPNGVKLDTLEVYRLILYDHKYSTSGRLVRVFDNGVVVTKNTEDNTVLSGIDSLFEGTGLVPEYEVTNKGIMLTRLKGLDNVEYIIRIRNDVTGEERSITESIDQEYFNNTNETLFVDYFKLDYTNREEIDVFKSDNFKDVFSWYGKPVRGAKELLKFQVSLTDLVNADEYSQLSWVDPITQEAKVYDLKESNSYIQIVDSKLKEEGFKPVYKVATFLKDGKEFGEAVYLEDVLDKEGNSVMALNGDTGYLIEMVDSMGQRSEPLAEDGVTALGSEEAIAREGDVISLVGLIQGVYDRRETHVDLTLEETEIIAEGDVLE